MAGSRVALGGGLYLEMTSPAISGIHLARNRRTKAYQLCRILFPSCSPAPCVLAWSGEWRAPRVVENEAQAGQFTEAIRLRKTTNTISRDEIRFFLQSCWFGVMILSRLCRFGGGTDGHGLRKNTTR